MNGGGQIQGWGEEDRQIDRLKDRLIDRQIDIIRIRLQRDYCMEFVQSCILQ